MVKRKWIQNQRRPPETATHAVCFNCHTLVERTANFKNSFVRPTGTHIDVYQCPDCRVQFMVERYSEKKYR